MRPALLTLTLLMAWTLACGGTEDDKAEKRLRSLERQTKELRSRMDSQDLKAWDVDLGSLSRSDPASASVGPFQIGQKPPAAHQHPYLKYVYDDEERHAEDGSWVVRVLKVMQGSELVAVVTLDKGGAIGEIDLHSPHVLMNGVGAGSTLEELRNAYPRVRFGYSYISSRFWADSYREARGVQFNISNTAFRGDRGKLGMSDWDELRLDQFHANTRVETVRFY